MKGPESLHVDDRPLASDTLAVNTRRARFMGALFVLVAPFTTQAGAQE